MHGAVGWNMKWRPIIVGGIIVGFVIMLIDIIIGGFLQLILPYDIFQLGGMRKSDDPIMLLFFIHPWVLGFALSFVYSYIGDVLNGNHIAKGWRYGFLMWIVIFVPYAFLVFSSMDYPIGFVVNSIIPPFVYMIVSGVLIAKTFEWLR
jgi:hypothetical protein